MVSKSYQVALAIIASLAITSESRGDQTEILFWKSLENSTDGEEYCAYIGSYPIGKFLPLARIRAKKYGGACINSNTHSINTTSRDSPRKEPPKNFDNSTARQSFFSSENYFKAKKAFDSQDYRTAIRLWTISAEKGHAEAQGFIGGMYHAGLGVKKDYKIALDWYKKAAIKGVAQAQLGIGNLYGDGLGVKKDYVRARMWFAISANAGNQRAQYNLKKISLRMDPENIAKSEELALEWMKKHNQL